MNDDDVRDALTRYAAGTPDLDPRAGLAMRLARRDRARRAAVAGVACLAAAIAGTGVAALSRDPGTRGLAVASDPAPSVTATAEPTPTAKPSEEPSAEPTPTAAPTTEPAPTADPTRAESPTPEPTRAHEETSTDYGAHGLEVNATLTNGTTAGTAETLRVVATDDDGDVQITGLAWGDGTHQPIAVHAYSCAAPETPAPTGRPKHPDSLDDSYAHAWRNPGRYTVTVTVASGNPCLTPPAKYEDATVKLVVDVAPGRDLSNGPIAPDDTYGHTAASETTPRAWTADWTVQDADGYVRSITFDWGDGSEPVTFTNEEPCDDGDGEHYPWTTFHASDEHRYEAGKHTLTVTWVSTGCDGADEQRGRKQVAIDVESVD